MNNPQVNINSLKREVMRLWDNQGIDYLNTEVHAGLNVFGGFYAESMVDDAHEAILEDIPAMVSELGFDSIASYIASKGAVCLSQ